MLRSGPMSPRSLSRITHSICRHRTATGTWSDVRGWRWPPSPIAGSTCSWPVISTSATPGTPPPYERRSSALVVQPVLHLDTGRRTNSFNVIGSMARASSSSASIEALRGTFVAASEHLNQPSGWAAGRRTGQSATLSDEHELRRRFFFYTRYGAANAYLPNEEMTRTPGHDPFSASVILPCSLQVS